MPPGTGDIALTLSQRVPLTGAVIVTTPQDIALLDAKKGLDDVREGRRADPRHRREHGVYVCPNCGHTEHIFGADGGKRMAEQYKVDYLGALPLDIVDPRADRLAATRPWWPSPTARSRRSTSRWHAASRWRIAGKAQGLQRQVPDHHGVSKNT